MAVFALGALLLALYAGALLLPAAGSPWRVLGLAAGFTLAGLLLAEDAVFATLASAGSAAPALNDLQNYVFMVAGGPAAVVAVCAGLSASRPWLRWLALAAGAVQALHLLEPFFAGSQLGAGGLLSEAAFGTFEAWLLISSAAAFLSPGAGSGGARPGS